MCLVKIGRQEEAGLIQEHRIDAHDEVAAVVILAGEVPANDIVGDREKTAVGAVVTLDPGLLADAPDPFIGAGRLIARPAGLAALEAAGMDILPPAKE